MVEPSPIQSGALTELKRAPIIGSKKATVAAAKLEPMMIDAFGRWNYDAIQVCVANYPETIPVSWVEAASANLQNATVGVHDRASKAASWQLKLEPLEYLTEIFNRLEVPKLNTRAHEKWSACVLELALCLGDLARQGKLRNLALVAKTALKTNQVLSHGIGVQLAKIACYELSTERRLRETLSTQLAEHLHMQAYYRGIMEVVTKSGRDDPIIQAVLTDLAKCVLRGGLESGEAARSKLARG